LIYSFVLRVYNVPVTTVQWIPGILAKTKIVVPKPLDHLTLQCPYALAIWAGAVSRLRLPNIVSSDRAELEEWWPLAIGRFARTDRKAANSFIMLVMRTLWLERNARVFDRKATTAQVTLRLLLDE
jgi:hypothetical protein